jgi:hypothetical protein
MADLTTPNLTEQQILGQDPEVQGLQRQRQLANLLTGQAFNQPQGQMISGHYVRPSALQQALPMINAGIGALTNANLDTKQTELAAALRGQKAEALNKFQTLMANPETRSQAMQFAAGNQYLQPLVTDLMKPQNLAEGARLVMPNLGGGAPIDLAVGGEKKTEAMRGYELAKSQGFPGSFVEYETALKRAGAPSVSVSMDKGLAAQVGPMMKESKEKTIGAVKEIDAANQVIGAIDSNKMFTGPLANQRLSVAQLGSTLGVGGKDVTEKVNNTRAAIQGLAEITLQGRQEMRGQGAITESEGKLAERAKSGDISLTPGELKQLANAAKRAGEYTYTQHQAQLQAMSQNPETKQLIPYYNVPMMPQRQAPQTPVQPNANQQLNIPATNGWKVTKVE